MPRRGPLLGRPPLLRAGVAMCCMESETVGFGGTTRRPSAPGSFTSGHAGRLGSRVTGPTSERLVPLNRGQPPQTISVQDPPALAVGDAGPNHSSWVRVRVELLPGGNTQGPDGAFLGAGLHGPYPGLRVPDVQVPGCVGRLVDAAAALGTAWPVPSVGFGGACGQGDPLMCGRLGAGKLSDLPQPSAPTLRATLVCPRPAPEGGVLAPDQASSMGPAIAPTLHRL